MPTTVKGRFFYWYMMQDIYSRKLVVNEVHESESANHASELLSLGCLREQTAGRPLGKRLCGRLPECKPIDMVVDR